MSYLLADLNQIATLFLRIACIWAIIEVVYFFKHKTLASRKSTSVTAQQNSGEKTSWKRSVSQTEGVETTRTAPITATPHAVEFYGDRTAAASDFGAKTARENSVPRPERETARSLPWEGTVTSFSSYESHGAASSRTDANAELVTQNHTQNNVRSLSPEKNNLYFYFNVKDDKELRDFLNGSVRPRFIHSDSGPLKGVWTRNRRYEVVPTSEELTEGELNYSPIKLCFRIRQGIESGKKVKVHVARPAILYMNTEGTFQIEEAGDLEVIKSYAEF